MAWGVWVLSDGQCSRADLQRRGGRLCPASRASDRRRHHWIGCGKRGRVDKRSCDRESSLFRQGPTELNRDVTSETVRHPADTGWWVWLYRKGEFPCVCTLRWFPHLCSPGRTKIRWLTAGNQWSKCQVIMHKILMWAIIIVGLVMWQSCDNACIYLGMQQRWRFLICWRGVGMCCMWWSWPADSGPHPLCLRQGRAGRGIPLGLVLSSPGRRWNRGTWKQRPFRARSYHTHKLRSYVSFIWCLFEI